MDQYIANHFKIDFKPNAAKDATFTGETYRISFLTSRIVRLEYAVDGVFENHPTQVFWYREQLVPQLSVKEDGAVLEIETEHLRLKYLKEHPFSGDTLSIELKYSCQIWRFGTQEDRNLGGTARTLDGINGELRLEKGLMSRDGFVVIDDSKSLIFNEQSWLAPRQTTGIDTYFFGYGTEYKACLADYTKLTGHTPMLPRYALGNWWSRYWHYTDTELETLINRFESEEIPLSVCIIDMDWHKTNIDPKYGSGWTGYSWNKDLFKDPEGFLKWLHSKNLKTGLNLHPALGIRGFEDCYKDVAEFMEVDVEAEQPVPFDISDPKFMKAYFELVHNPMEDDGVDFWWMDWQQGTNSSIKGLDPLYFLNHLHYLDLGRDGSKRPFTFSRWPGLGGHRYPIGFSGDTVVSWESLSYQPYFTSTAANVNFGWWSHDIGGHFQGIDDSELYARWVQYGVFSPITRLHTSSGIFNRREPWRHSHEAFTTTKKYLNLRHELVPYIYTMSYRNSQTGLSCITPLYYEYPHDGLAYDYRDEYFFGSELLVAPYVTPRSKILNKTFKDVYLPEGNWFDFATGEPYNGNTIYPMYGKLDEIPVFAKAGAIIPMAHLEETNQMDNPKHLNVLVFGKGVNTFEMYEDDGISTEYEAGHFAKTRFSVSSSEQELVFTISPTEGDLSVVPTQRSYTIKFRGVTRETQITATLHGHPLAFKTSYDEQSTTLSVTLENMTLDHDIEICLAAVDLFDYKYDVYHRIIDLVQEAAIPMDEKQRFEWYSYGILNESLSIEERMIRLLAMPVNEEVRRAALAILVKSQL